jgi:prevent-host-death family protein
MTGPAELPEIPQRELRNNASRVLRDVRAGRSYTITVDGTPVADLIPHRNVRRRIAVPRDEVIAAFAGLTSSGAVGVTMWTSMSMIQHTIRTTAHTAAVNSQPETASEIRPGTWPGRNEKDLAGLTDLVSASALDPQHP